MVDDTDFWDAELDRIFNEPPDPRLLKLAGKAVESMKRYDAWFAALSLEDQVTVLFVALAGATAATSCKSFGIVMFPVDGDTLIPVAPTEFTVTTNVSLSEPSTLLAEIDMLNDPTVFNVPLNTPFPAFTDIPDGKLDAAYVEGKPDAAIV